MSNKTFYGTVYKVTIYRGSYATRYYVKHPHLDEFVALMSPFDELEVNSFGCKQPGVEFATPLQWYIKLDTYEI